MRLRALFARVAVSSLAFVALFGAGVPGAHQPASATTNPPAPTVTLTGSIVPNSDLSETIGDAFSYNFDDVLWELCDLVPGLNGYGYTYDEIAYCPDATSSAWNPDLSVHALCQSILVPAGAVIVDVAASKTSAWTLDNAGNARGCVFPQLGATDIKSLVSKYRTAMFQYRGQGMTDLLKALDTCDLTEPTNQSPQPCKVYNASTQTWVPDPKKLPALALPPAPPAVTAAAVTVTGVAAMSAGGAFQVFAKSDGTVISRCDSTTPTEAAGQCMAPSTTAGSLRVAAAAQHALALRADGTVVEWGSITSGGALTASRAPTSLTSVVDIAAGENFSLALKSDGTVVGWGDNAFGQTTIPTRATDVVAVAAGRCHAVALKSDGTVVTWGCNNASQLSAEGAKATTVQAHGDTTVMWNTSGAAVTAGANRGGSAPLSTGSLGAYDTGLGAYFAGSGACVVDKGEDVTRGGLPSNSPKAEAPLGLSTNTTPATSTSWIYTWSAPKNTAGKPILRYEGRVYDSKTRTFGPWITVTSPFTALKQPSPRLSRFTVRAVTSGGAGVEIFGAEAQVATSESRLCGVDQISDWGISLNRASVAAPPVPTVIAGSAAPGAVKVAWTTNSFAGGTARPVASVQLSSDGGKTWKPVTSRGCTAIITGLAGGGAYQVKVVLTNSAGSTSSAAVNAQTYVDVSATSLAVGSVGSRTVGLTWKAPAKLTGLTLKDYRIETSADGAAWIPFVRKASTKTTASVTGLLAATAYRFRVVPVTSSGDGIPSDPVAATTPVDVPGLVPAPTLGVVAATTFSIGWAAPADNGGQPITGYSVKVTPAVSQVNVSGTTATMIGSKVGVTYTFVIAAINGKGTGASTTTKITVVGVPGAPTLTATRAATSVTVTWKAPSNTGGAKITGYTTSVSPSNVTYSVSGTKATFTGLTPGTVFTFSVAAINSAGTGATAQIVTGTTAVPGLVTLTYASKDASNLLVSWTAPTDDGGSKITGYQISTSRDGGITFTTPAKATGTSAIVAKPGAKQSVIIRVSAINAVGVGAVASITVTG